MSALRKRQIWSIIFLVTLLINNGIIMAENLEEYITTTDAPVSNLLNIGKKDEDTEKTSFSDYQTSYYIPVGSNETDITTDIENIDNYTITDFDIFGANETTINPFHFNDINRAEVERLKQLDDYLEIIHKNQTETVHYFVDTHNQSAGQIANTETHMYVEELKKFLESFKLLNQIIDEDGDETMKQEFETIYFHDLNTYQSLLNTNQHLEYALDQISSLSNQLNSIRNVHEEIQNRTMEFNRLCDLSIQKKNIEEKEKEINTLQNFSQSIRNVSDFIKLHNLSDTFNNTKTSKLLNFKHFESLIPVLYNEKKKDEELLQYFKSLAEDTTFLEYKIQAPLQGIIFIMGVLGNGVLLIIFIRHKEMRISPNLMLINLAFGELLSLVVSIPTTYMYYFTASGNTTDAACKAFTFFRVQGIGVSAYSLVVISIQRYLAMTQLLEKRWGIIGRRLKSALIILLVWAIGSIVAIPYTLLAGAKDGNCYAGLRGKDKEMRLVTDLFGFLGICIVPVILNSTFTGLSADRLRRSAKQMPGERIGQRKLQKRRVLSSNVLVVLIIIFAVCYTPYYMFNFIYTWFHVYVEEVRYRYTTSLTYCLIFVHSSLNPVALYFVSKKYRNYFNKYLLCGKTCRSHYNSSEISTDTTTSSLDTKV